MTRRTLTAIPTTIVAATLLLGGASSAHDRGVEDGMRDLCGEMGGTWDDSEHGWCDR